MFSILFPTQQGNHPGMGRHQPQTLAPPGKIEQNDATGAGPHGQLASVRAEGRRRSAEDKIGLKSRLFRIAGDVPDHDHALKGR